MALSGVASRMMLRAPSSGSEATNSAGMMAKYFATSLAIENVVRAGHQQLLADLDDLDELGRVGIEVDHVAGLACGLGAGLHGDADIGLGEPRIVGAVAAHGDEAVRCPARCGCT